MPEQQSTSPPAVILASVVFVIAGVAFGAACWYFDGVGLARGLIATVFSDPSAVPSQATETTTTSGDLVLPPNMPEAFALRIWQEQMDSQGAIGKLVDGKLRSFVVESAETTGDSALLRVKAVFRDGSVAPGVLAFRRFGGVWYVAQVTGMREGSVTGDARVVRRAGTVPPSVLPSIKDVDVPLLNVILAENANSSAVIKEYLESKVASVDITTITPGPGTVTLGLTMREDHETGYADLIAISKEIKGERVWFLVRFNKTGSEPLRE